MNSSKAQHMALLALASMAFADLANAASESGVDSLNEMFNEGGVGYEASQAIKAEMGSTPTKDTAVELAMHLLRVADHPLADLYDAQKAGELYLVTHTHRHGMGSSLMRFSPGADIEATLMAHDSQTYELDREDEYVETYQVDRHFAFEDLRNVEADEEEEAEAG